MADHSLKIPLDDNSPAAGGKNRSKSKSPSPRGGYVNLSDRIGAIQDMYRREEYKSPRFEKSPRNGKSPRGNKSPRPKKS
mmetsp:Transcript_52431/g.59943  ORF Transcript_52431/g.59943 Transcript_52431/m.59943 type:complete len:80 (-) Transcript_52431:1301-1540(-)